MKIAAQVLFHARVNPDRPALAFHSATATYGMLARGVTTCCLFLRREHLPPGSVVAIEVGNPIHHIALILALELCGITSISVHTRYAFAEAGVRVDALLIDAAQQPDQTVRTIRINDNWFAMAAAIDVTLTGGIPDDQYYRIILSSGTTGRPKAVGFKPPLIGRFLLHTSLMRGEAGARSLGLLGFSTLAVLSPLFTLVQGGFASFAGTADEAMTLVRTLGIEWISYVTPSFLEALVAVARTSAEPPPSLRTVYVSGAKVPPTLIAEARARLCRNLVASYASTEAGILTRATLGGVSEPDGSAGYVLPWVEIEATGADGRQLPRGTEGMIRVRSPDLAEYVLPPGADGQIAPSGWFHTGDIGFVRPDGLLVITGRSAEVINRGGAIVAPDYIERVLESHPSVKEAAAFAQTSQSGIDEIWVAVVLRAPLDISALLEEVRPRLADKTPDRIAVVDALPRTDTGKVQRSALRERFALSLKDS